MVGLAQKNKDVIAQNMFYKQIVESILDLVICVNLDGKIVYANPSFLNLTGYRLDKLLGTAFTNIVPNNKKNDVRAIAEVAFSGRSIPLEKITILNKNKSEFELEIRTWPIYGKGKMLGFCMVAEPAIKMLSQKEKFWKMSQTLVAQTRGINLALKKLRKTEELYRGVVESANDMIFIIDKKANILYANPQAEKSFAPKKLRGKYFGFIMKDKFVSVFNYFRDAYMGKQTPLFYTDLKVKGNKLIAAEIKAQPLFEAGKITSVLVTIRDITERRKLAQEVLERLKELDVLSKIDALTTLPNITVDEMLKQIVKMLPIAWRFSDRVYAKITYNNKKYKTKNYKKTKWRKTVPMKINGKNLGAIEVGYLKENRFLKEENDLIKTVAYKVLLAIERKKAEDEIKRKAQSYYSIFDNSTDALFVHDAETGEILDVNETMLKMYGFSKAEALKKNIGDFSSGVPPYDLKHAVKLVRKAMKEGPQTFEWRAKDKKGKLFWADVCLKKINLEGKTRILASVRNIEERKKAESALRKSEERFRKLVKLNKDAIWEVDENTKIIYYSSAIKGITGYAPEELIGKGLDNIISPGHKKEVARLISEMKKNPVPLLNLEFENIHKNGKKIIVQTSALPIFNKEGKLTGYIGIDRDITSEKIEEEHLEQLVKERTKALQDEVEKRKLAERQVKLLNANLERIIRKMREKRDKARRP
ncbi:MAG: PAS domain S-box protein [Candidatus Diapherotrites archaeon]|nr:PAS domain S-box protein [Candidatus Diapherotrites archaeon]